MANVDPKVRDYKERIKVEAEELVNNQFPKKILELETLLKTEKNKRSNLGDIHADLNIPVPEPLLNHDDSILEPSVKKRKFDAFENNITGTKVLALTSGVSPCNKNIVELVDTVKPCIRQLVEDANVLKMWIQFLIPRIEDGNNFGVSIQEETLAEIRTVESDGAAFFDQISRYFMTRGKIVSKVAKYPHVEDYRRTIQELDEKEYLSLLLVMCELRNHYVIDASRYDNEKPGKDQAPSLCKYGEYVLKKMDGNA
uniref:Proteasome activator PA28 C-terminal domain-containing protein n=1 Tax=Strigamia maritima TaxID=126957 RepID=T1J8E6_STRMM